MKITIVLSNFFIIILLSSCGVKLEDRAVTSPTEIKTTTVTPQKLYTHTITSTINIIYDGIWVGISDTNWKITFIIKDQEIIEVDLLLEYRAGSQGLIQHFPDELNGHVKIINNKVNFILSIQYIYDFTDTWEGEFISNNQIIGRTRWYNDQSSYYMYWKLTKT